VVEEEAGAEKPSPDEEATVEVAGEVAGEEVVRGIMRTTMETSSRTTTCPSLVNKQIIPSAHRQHYDQSGSYPDNPSKQNLPCI